MKFLRIFLALIAVAAVARAQQFDNPVTIPISYYGFGNVTYIPTGQSASFSFGSSLGATSSVSSSTASPGSMLYSNEATAYIVPGQTYNVTVTSAYMGDVVVYFQPVDGCAFYINGNRGNSFSAGANYTFQLVVASSGDFTQKLRGQRGGAFTSFAEDKAIWFIGLGSCRNGRFAGAVGFRQATITSSLFNTSSLMCTATDTAEVSITRDGGGHITEVQSRDVVLMMDPYNGSGTSYHIYAYTPANLTTPFITYLISQVTNGIEIDRTEDGTTTKAQLLYSAGTWTRYDWQIYGSSWVNQSTTSISGSTNSVTYGTGSGTPTKTKTYASVGSQTELISAALGSTSLSAQPVTAYTFYTTTGGSGWFDAVQSISYPNGSWIKYDYYNTSTSMSQGMVQNVYRPWGPSTPASPSGANSANCRYETWTYTTNYDGSTTAPAERQVYLDGTFAGDTKWTYNWNYATVNSHVITQVVERDYANSSTSLSTTTLGYLETDGDSFFHGRPHSVTRPDGTKDSYGYFYGSWNSSTYSFNATGSGNDRDILVFHGQTTSGSGTTYVAAWTASGGESWNLDPLYLANNLSTVSESVIDTNGHLVFAGEYIFNGSTLVRIQGHAYTYNGNNLLVTDTDVVKSTAGTVAVTYAYTYGLPKSMTGSDGVQQFWGYDPNTLYNTQQNTANNSTYGSYPARDVALTYTNAGQKSSSKLGSDTATQYYYDSAGRITSQVDPAPGGSSLTTSYSYPTLEEVDITYPNGSTKKSYSSIDGTTVTLEGTAQPQHQATQSLDSANPGYIITTTQGFPTSGAPWSSVESDWLGRTVYTTSPEQGAAPGSSSVRIQTCSYASTGQLNSIATTDKSSGTQLLPTHYFEYGNLGMLTEEGDDVNCSGTLDPVSTDRITYHSLSYYQVGSSWISEAKAQMLRNVNDGSSLATISDVQTYLTNLNGGSLYSGNCVVSEVVSIDPSGRTTQTMIGVNASSLSSTQWTTIQGVSNQAVKVWTAGLLASDETMSANTTTYVYNAQGKELSSASGNGVTQSLTYYASTDFVDTITHSISGGTSTTTYSYTWNPSGGTNTVSSTDQSGAVSYTEYNSMGMAYQTWGTATHPIQFNYDTWGRKTGYTTWQSTSGFTGSSWPSSPGSGNSVTLTLDSSTGWITEKTFPDSTYTSYSYNDLGQITKRVDAQSRETDYGYFSSSGALTAELESITYRDGVTPDVSFTYTRTGAKSTVSDAAGTRTMSYGTDLKLGSEGFNNSFYTSGSLAVTSSYDSYGRPTGFSANGNVTLSETFGYDSLTGRITSIQAGLSPYTSTFSLSYSTGTDLVSSVTNGSYTVSTPVVSNYDVIASATTTYGTTQLASFTGVFGDSRGLRTGEDSGTGSGTPTGSWSKLLGLGDGLNVGSSGYSLDSYTQVSYAPAPTWTGTAGTQSLTAREFEWWYDNAGNRTQEEDQGSGSFITTYTPNANDQYGSITGHLAETTTYSPEGNLTQDGGWTYTFDSENRVTQMSNSSETINCVYDYLGRRISKTVTASGTATTTKFLWQGRTLIADLRSDGNSVIRSYVWGLDQAGGTGTAGALLALYNPGWDLAFTIPDAQGNIAGYYDVSTGSIVAAFEYSPYGRLLNSYIDTAAGYTASSFPIGYSGEYTDYETGLVYYGSRYYQPTQGRFVSRDPIGASGGQNLYEFCQNDSVNLWDDFGQDPIGMPAADAAAKERAEVLGNALMNAQGLGGQNTLSDLIGSRWDDSMDGGNNVPVLVYNDSSGDPFSSTSVVENIFHGSAFANSWTNLDPTKAYGVPTAPTPGQNASNDNNQNTNYTSSPPSNGNSTLGNLLRNIPLIGGMLGAAGDILSGVANTTLGVITLGQSGTLGLGLSEMGYGVGQEIDIMSRDVLAGLAGAAGKIYVTTREFANLATFGQIPALGVEWKGVSTGATGFLGALKDVLLDTPVPMYGDFNGPAWGVPNFGLDPSLRWNQSDAAAYIHDQYYQDAQWLRDQYTTNPQLQWVGPIGSAYALFGTIPFSIISLFQKP